MADLWERLRAAKAKTDQAAAAPEPPPEGAWAPGAAPQGWKWAAPLVAERRLTLGLDPGFWRAVGGDLDQEDWDRVLCFDTETTGLSGGAGTTAFLVGWARLIPAPLPGEVPSAEVRQWFLRDLPGEPDLVEAVDRALAGARGLVSFNGASFDLPLLRSRWALAGRTFPELPHRDDLHPSRRLWKRILDSCRLGHLEERILGLRRLDDVPGAQVPVLWYDYLRSGAGWDFAAPLEGVLRHHAQDVYSLLCLDLVLGALTQNPNSSRWDAVLGPCPGRTSIARPAPAGGLLHPDLGRSTPVDFWGLLALKEGPQAEASLEAAWEDRDDEALGLAWADRLKRQNNPAAKQIWTRLWETRRSYPALEELLKWLEHRERSPASRAEALGLVDEGLKAPFLPRSWKEGLEKRRERLVRRDRPSAVS